MSEPGIIPENSAGPDRGLADEKPVAKPGRRVQKGEQLSEETKRKISEGVKAAQARRRGEASGDKPPKAKRSQAQPPDRRAEELRMIREWAGGLLAAPAMVGGIAQDPWIVDHFTTRGPALADALVKEAERNDRLRAMLVNLASAAGPAALIIQTALYVGLPLMHFGVLPGAPIFGVPVIRQAPRAPQRPEPGETPPFIAPERGPATAPPGRPIAEGWESVEQAAEHTGIPVDALAAELAAHENGGGMMPPLPMEPV